MNKVMFLQIKGKSFGGIWQVNKALCNKLYSLGYDVQVCSIRNNHPGDYEETKFQQNVINPNDLWEITHKRDVLISFSKGPFIFIKTLSNYFKDHIKLKQDYSKMKKYIKKENPDYIVASHYQTLRGIPKKYLYKTVHVQHSAFKLVLEDKNNFKTLKKYNKKIFSLLWLSKATCEKAKKSGFIKNKFIYNPVRIECQEIPNVKKNKSFVVLSRFSEEKRINLMIKIVDEVFKDERFKQWSFNLYGQGKLNEESKNILSSSNQIFYKGVVQNPKEALLNSSCSLNTSIFEGFPLSIVESLTCGIPALIFDYGESSQELIQNGINGYVIKQDDISAFKNQMIEIMENEQQLEKMSLNAKESSKKYSVDVVISEWKNLFNEIDLGCQNGKS